jgi:curved DNA-binding protein
MTLVNLLTLQFSEPDHYATLGLDRQCTAAQIREAYRLLAKQFHPDVNHNSPDAKMRTQEINIAHEILSDPELRRDYDRARDKGKNSPHSSKAQLNVSQDVQLRLEDFLRGTLLEVRVKDPVKPGATELYQLIVPPETAPGARFRLPRVSGGLVLVRVRALPNFRFKVRGSDLRCDLRINTKRVVHGGEEMVMGLTGNRLRVKIPARVERGEIIRIAGEGLPKARGGRGDLLVRIDYRVEVRVSRQTRR